MPGSRQRLRTRIRRWALVATVAGAGLATAAVATIAAARTFTLSVATRVAVTNVHGVTVHESIIVTARGQAVYTLSGDTRRHPKCTKANGCFALWAPVTVSAARRLSKAPGVKGRVSAWRRNGRLQVLLAGHPLYTFAHDTRRGSATGEGVRSFHGTWHVSTSLNRSPGTQPGTSTSASPTTSTTTSTTTLSTVTTAPTTTFFHG